MDSRKLILIFLACALAAPAAFAQSDKDPPKPANARFGNPTSIARHLQDYLYGMVKQVGEKEIVLDKTKYGIDQTIKVYPKTKYVRDGNPSTLAELKVGDTVYVDVKTDKKTGDMSAKKIISGILPRP